MKRNRIKQHYERRVTTDRASHDVLDWGSAEAQIARFEVLALVLEQIVSSPVNPPLASPSNSPAPQLLDIGCGLTDLCSFLHERPLPVRYVGVDISFPMLREASRRFPQRNILEADVFEAPPFRPGAFDVTFASGVFNLRLGNNDPFAASALRGMCRLARVVAVANFLHVRTRKKYPHCHYFDPDSIAVEAAGACRKVDIVDDYLENDFTVVCRI